MPSSLDRDIKVTYPALPGIKVGGGRGVIFLFRQMIRISTFYFSGHASRRFDPIRSDGTILLEGCARGAETPRRLHVGLRPARTQWR